MSFGPERAGRHSASVDSPIARTTRRLLLTGGCVFAGWIGASALGGVAHAATPETPVSSVLSTVSATSQHLAGGVAQHRTDPSPATHDARASVSPVLNGPTMLNGLDTSVHRAVAKALDGKGPSSITIRPARRSAASGNQLGDDVTGRLHSLDPAVQPVTDTVVNTDKVLKPVTDSADRVVEPVASKIKPAAGQIVDPVADSAGSVVKPVAAVALHATHSVAVPGNGDALAGLGDALISVTGTVHDIALPGLTSIGQPTPVALNLAPVDPAQYSPLRRAARYVRSAVHRAGRTAIQTTRHPAARSSAHAVVPSTAPVQRLLPGYVTPVVASISHRNPIAVSGASRAPNAPIVPAGPQLPAGASTGSAPGSSLNTSGSSGGSPVALDSDADAPFRTLGTVDPTDASMARSVAKRPSTSPD